jgi:hypothetical protein
VSIFVSIAAYRDPQLGPTVEDCLATADDPAGLRFGICWQGDPSDAPPAFRGKQFRILERDWRESRGVCWARSQIMGLYEGEDWYLQLDSHHRFVEGWDTRLLALAAEHPSERPILTTYAAALDLDQPHERRREPRRIEFGRWAGQVPLFLPGFVPRRRSGGGPFRARFLSGHFCFTTGDFVRDVPYDPELYFAGEEITLSVRAFTAGYDLFHPLEPILWHEYTRSYRRTHWGDHKEPADPWHELDKASRTKVARLLTTPWVGPDGLGTARSLADYEAYAGICFARCRVQDYTRQHQVKEPSLREWGLLDEDRWVVTLQDALERPIHREEVPRAEVGPGRPWTGPTAVTKLRFRSDREPASWALRAAGSGSHRGLRGYVGRTNVHGGATIEPET